MTPKKEKQTQLTKRMEKLGIFEEDLIEKFILGSGKGGQKVNKTHSCVYLKHLPSQIEVKCQQERSRDLNRFYARKMLCDKMEEKLHFEESKRKKEIDKIRKQKKRRSRKLKQKLVEEKRTRSQTKQFRKPPKEE